MSSAQVKERKSKEGRTGPVWTLYDPGSHYENLVKAAVKKHEEHLHPGERSSQGLLKLIMENLDVVVLAIRPKPVVPTETDAIVEHSETPVK